MAEEKRDGDSVDWAPNPVNEQRAAPVRDGQPHSMSEAEDWRKKPGVMVGPQPSWEEVSAFARKQNIIQRAKDAKKKAAIDAHMKKFTYSPE